MPFSIPIEEATRSFPEYDFVTSLTPSEQKCAFHVRRKGTKEDLCLKIVAPGYNMDRLQREIEALQQLEHPNIVRLIEYTYSSTTDSLRHYIIEEFIEGDDLTDSLTGVPWDRSRAIAFFIALAEGLESLRLAQVVHRDLKPQNIRVRTDGMPVIIDFGLARHLTKSSLTQTADGAQIGTPLYFSPEQFQGTKRDIDHRTDLFALGVMLCEALTGQHPFAGAAKTFAELASAVCAGTVKCDRFDALPNDWKLVLRKLLAVERSHRINTAGQLAAVLGKLKP